MKKSFYHIRSARLAVVLTAVVVALVAGSFRLAPAEAKRKDAAGTTADTTTTSTEQVSSTSTVSVPAVCDARLTVRISATSTWAKVRVSPGRLVAQRPVAGVSTVDIQTSPDGWLVTPVGDSGSVALDVVFTEPTDAASLRLDLEKGTGGTARVVVENHNAAPFTVADMTKRGRKAGTTTVTKKRDGVFGRTPLELPRADGRRLVLAFYYPWFSDYHAGDLEDRPLDPRSTYETLPVLSMTQQARAHGVDGFIVSWAGEAANGPGFDRALYAAEQTEGYVTGYLETLKATDASGAIDPFRLRDMLLELLSRSDSPAFLKDANGIPVVFVWQTESVPVETWQAIAGNLASLGHPVRLVGDATDGTYEALGAWHKYVPGGTEEHRTRQIQRITVDSRAAALLYPGQVQPRLVAGGVAPGFSKNGTDIVARGSEGERYDATWRATLAGDPDWVVVTSWNEWYEATSIEPSERFGSRALEQTAAWAQSWKD